MFMLRGAAQKSCWNMVDVCGLRCVCGGVQVTYPPPPLAHARPCLSTGWALNRCFEEILRPLFLWSRMEDWVLVECLYREKGLGRVCYSALCS